MAYGFFRLLPFPAASALGGWLARMIGPALRVSNRARRNLASAFPEKNPAEITTIVRDMWDNLGRTAGEYPHVDRIDVSAPDSRIEVVGADNIDLLRDDGKPGFFFTGHLANWELTSLPVIQRGVDLAIVYRAANNPHLDWLFNRRGTRGAYSLIPKGSEGAKEIVKAIKQGRHVGMLVDQKMNDGIPVKFFGRDAMTAPALAQMSLKYDCPVVPVRIERVAGTRFRITFYPPMTPEVSADHHGDVAKFMESVNGYLEDWIRERPAQWLWLHNRWPADAPTD